MNTSRATVSLIPDINSPRLDSEIEGDNRRIQLPVDERRSLAKPLSIKATSVDILSNVQHVALECLCGSRSGRVQARQDGGVGEGIGEGELFILSKWAVEVRGKIQVSESLLEGGEVGEDVGNALGGGHGLVDGEVVEG